MGSIKNDFEKQDMQRAGSTWQPSAQTNATTGHHHPLGAFRCEAQDLASGLMWDVQDPLNPL